MDYGSVIKTIQLKIHVCFISNNIDINVTNVSLESIKDMAHWFAGVIGCIDGTHIPIICSSTNDFEEFRCRKGYFSINTQAVCDPDLRFTDLVARWKGTTQDSRIWNNSALLSKFEAGNLQGFLLGDNGLHKVSLDTGSGASNIV